MSRTEWSLLLVSLFRQYGFATELRFTYGRSRPSGKQAMVLEHCGLRVRVVGNVSVNALANF
jgi:hypothetical protein